MRFWQEGISLWGGVSKKSDVNVDFCVLLCRLIKEDHEDHEAEIL